MKNFLLILLYFINNVLVLSAQGTPGKWGDQGNGTYINPILNADYSDPDVIRVRDKYYMIASDFHFLGMQVLESSDMINWKLISQIYHHFDFPGWDNNQQYAGGSWAPSIRYHDNKFWVFFCTPKEGLFMSNAVNPSGPWSPLHLVKKVEKWEDPCPFWDEDGQAYLGRSRHGAGPIIISLFTVRLLKGKKHYPSDTEYILSDWNEDTNLDFNSQNELQELNEAEKPLMLIVEDNYELRVFIKQIFQEAYRFVEANNGEVGLKKAFSDLPDMIITDIMMPVKSGLQMLQELRNDERTSHIPAIVLTAKTDMDSILTGIHTGADDYITKPFSVNYLQAKVENILARRKMLQAYYCKVGYEEGNENKEKDRSVQLSARDAAFLNKLAKIMEEQLGNPELNVDQLVSYFSLSRTNFFHKLKSLTGMAPIMYIKEIRMRKAAELIKENQYTMAEIAYMVGFSDPHYFSKSFKSYWGMTSTEYAKNQIGR